MFADQFLESGVGENEEVRPEFIGARDLHTIFADVHRYPLSVLLECCLSLSSVPCGHAVFEWNLLSSRMAS